MVALNRQDFFYNTSNFICKKKNRLHTTSFTLFYLCLSFHEYFCYDNNNDFKRRLQVYLNQLETQFSVYVLDQLEIQFPVYVLLNSSISY